MVNRFSWVYRCQSLPYTGFLGPKGLRGSSGTRSAPPCRRRSAPARPRGRQVVGAEVVAAVDDEVGALADLQEGLAPGFRSTSAASASVASAGSFLRSCLILSSSLAADLVPPSRSMLEIRLIGVPFGDRADLDPARRRTARAASGCRSPPAAAGSRAGSRCRPVR